LLPLPDDLIQANKKGHAFHPESMPFGFNCNSFPEREAMAVSSHTLSAGVHTARASGPPARSPLFFKDLNRINNIRDFRPSGQAHCNTGFHKNWA